MIVRCGACRTSFDVPGPGRHRCPACGATNQVSAAPPGAAPPPGAPPPGAGPGGPVMPGGQPAPHPEAPPPNISKAVCGECGWDFIVGEVEVAICPNCSAEVALGGDPT